MIYFMMVSGKDMEKIRKEKNLDSAGEKASVYRKSVSDSLADYTLENVKPLRERTSANMLDWSWRRDKDIRECVREALRQIEEQAYHCEEGKIVRHKEVVDILLHLLGGL